MTPIAMISEVLPHSFTSHSYPVADTRGAKRKAEESTTVESKLEKRQKTAPIPQTLQKLAKSPNTAKPSTPAQKLRATTSNTTEAAKPISTQVAATAPSPASRYSNLLHASISMTSLGSAAFTTTSHPQHVTAQANVANTQGPVQALSAQPNLLPPPTYDPKACRCTQKLFAIR
jgi:hypothetical protein